MADVTISFSSIMLFRGNRILSRHLRHKLTFGRGISGTGLKSGVQLNRAVFFAAIGGAFIGAATVFATTTKNHEKNKPPQLSTSPIDTVEPVVYADNNDFELAVEKMKKVVGENNVSTDEAELKAQSDSFFSTHHPPDPLKQKPKALVYPLSTEEVAELVKIAHEYRVPVIATSGFTSLEGQAMHTRGPNSIALSFANMHKILKIHPEDLDMTVEAGTSWQDIDQYLLGNDDTSHLMFGPDPGMGACIAGMVSTSASGTNAYKYGTMKENVVNLTVVLADGTIIKTKQRPRKTSAGYDITRLFIGAEGTLGIITEITVKLHVRPVVEFVTLASFPTIKDAAATALEIISKSGLQPNAIEILNEAMVSFVNSSQGQNDHKFLEKPTLLFKFGGPTKKDVDTQVEVARKIASKNLLINLETSSNREDNDTLWTARRAGLWSTYEYGSKVLENKDDVQVWTTDIAVPISKLAQVISETNDDIRALGFGDKFSVMGHIGDGNCHFLILYNSPDYKKVQKVVDRMVYRAIDLEGTCTGEHGVGIGKRKYLNKELGKETVDLMRHLKLLMDPRRILNPDKIFRVDPSDTLDAQFDAAHIHDHGCCS